MHLAFHLGEVHPVTKNYLQRAARNHDRSDDLIQARDIVDLLFVVSFILYTCLTSIIPMAAIICDVVSCCFLIQQKWVCTHLVMLFDYILPVPGSTLRFDLLENHWRNHLRKSLDLQHRLDTVFRRNMAFEKVRRILGEVHLINDLHFRNILVCGFSIINWHVC